MRTMGVLVVATGLAGALLAATPAGAGPSADEIVAQLAAPTPRALGQIVEDEWDRPEVTCTAIEGRGIFYDEGDQVVRRPRLQMEVNFAFASAELTLDATRTLDQLATALNDPMLAEARFLLIGHTDAVGSEAANKALSERRARAVYDYLVDHDAIDPSRLRPRGCGETVLLDREDPKSPRNRRVEVVNAGRE